MMERLSIGIVLAALGGGESDQRAAAARADPADPEYQTHSVAKIRGPRHRLRNSDRHRRDCAKRKHGRHTHPGPESGYMLEGEMVAGARPA